MLRTNLATRPFYNERAAHLVIGIAAVIVLAITALNLTRVVTLALGDGEDYNIYFPWLGLDQKGIEFPTRHKHDIAALIGHRRLPFRVVPNLQRRYPSGRAGLQLGFDHRGLRPRRNQLLLPALAIFRPAHHQSRSPHPARTSGHRASDRATPRRAAARPARSSPRSRSISSPRAC